MPVRRCAVVFVETRLDSDRDGRRDRIRIRIRRPGNADVDVPVIFEHSPYRGRLGNAENHDVDLGALPRADLPGRLDDYYVPHGYAVVLGESIGTVVTVAVCYAGDLDRGEAVLAPLRSFGSPLVDAVGARPYVELQRLFDPSVPHGWHYHWRSWELPPLTDAAIDTLVDQAATITSPRSYIIVFQLGGADARVGEHETAYSQRDAAHNVNINAVWLEGDPGADRHVRWVHGCYAALEPHAGGHAYVNFLADEGADRVRAAYGPAKHDRLVALKRRHDPANVLRGNQNICP
jgi:hypothetical protein